MFDRRDYMVKLIAVAEAGKFVAAAEALNIAQPALTRTIAKLEGQFGGRLFDPHFSPGSGGIPILFLQSVY